MPNAPPLLYPGLMSYEKLLRLKCAAYSTLNGGDEDTKAEARVMEKMRDTGAAPFSPFRIAPASLYLTAIIEYVLNPLLWTEIT